MPPPLVKAWKSDGNYLVYSCKLHRHGATKLQSSSRSHRMKTVKLLIALLAVAWLGINAQAHAQTKPASKPATAKATFAGGCFWCMEPPYDKLPGVISTISGYMGG